MGSKANRGGLTSLGLVLALAALAPGPASAQKTVPVPSSTQYDELFARYLDAARKQATPRGLWLVDLMGDPRARHVNDLLTVRVDENISASGTADASLAKSGSATVGLPTPLSNSLSKILPATSDTKFSGAGSTTRASVISAMLTARVSEVLPNGDLVVEGVREIEVNGDRQVVVLTGVVRPVDILPGNLVSSAVIGQLRIRSIGRGLIKDSLSPGWLVRAINKIF